MAKGRGDDDERGGDGWTTTKGGSGRWTNISICLLVLLVVSHVHVVNSACTAKSCCYMTPLSGSQAQPTQDVQEVLSGNQTTPSTTGMCYVLYMLGGGKDQASQWNVAKYHYLAASTWAFDIDCKSVLKSSATVTCSLTTSKEGHSGLETRLDFVCCCKGNLCNDPIQNEAVNPRIQYTKKLNASGNAACFVDFKLRSPKKCKGKQSSQSMCHSQIINGKETLDCAQDDKGTDNCQWANGEDGVCRNNGSTFECCCSGAFCNGDAMMNMACRSGYSKSTDAAELRYGAGLCVARAPRPPTTTPPPRTTQSNTSTSQPGGTNPDDADATTTTDSSNLGLIIGLAAGFVVLLLLIALVVGLLYWRKKRRGSKKNKEEVESLDDTQADTSVGDVEEETEVGCSSNCTGFLGIAEYGAGIGFGKQMRKTYDPHVIKDFEFVAVTCSELDKYENAMNANVVHVIDIKLPKKSDPSMVITSKKLHPFTPVNRWWEKMAKDDGSKKVKEKMFLVNYCLAAQMMRAVAYLNSKKIKCFNIKGNNLLADETRSGELTLDLKEGESQSGQLKFTIPTIMLTDYAFEQVIATYVKIEQEKALKRPSSNVEWWPPELRTNYDFGDYTQSYMCGATMIELWNMGKKPFADIPEKERSCLYGKGEKAGDTPPLPECIPKGSYIELLMTRMMDKDRKKRPWPYEAAHSLRYIYINYTDKFFGPKASFENPAEQWKGMMPNQESINEGPEPMPDLPALKFDTDGKGGGVEEKSDASVKNATDDRAPFEKPPCSIQAPSTYSNQD